MRRQRVLRLHVSALPFLLGVIAVALPCFGVQRWEKVYGNTTYGDFAYDVKPTHDSGYVVAGIYDRFWRLLRLDSTGTILGVTWDPDTNRNTVTCSYAVATLADGGFASGGLFFGPTPSQAEVVKVSAGGQVVWQKILGPGCVEDIIETRDGGLVVAGERDTTPPSTCFWVARLDSFGNVLWNFFSGDTPQYCHAYAVRQTSDGGFLAVGDSSKSYHDYSPLGLVVRLDSAGHVLWTHLGFPKTSFRRVSIDSSGSFVLAGLFRTTSTLSLLERMNDTAGMLWWRTYGGMQGSYGEAVVKPVAGSGYFLTGTIWHDNGDCDVWAVRTDTNGNMCWSRTYGGPDQDRGYSVAATPDGGYIMVGQTWNFGAGYGDWYIIKTDSGGSSAIQEAPKHVAPARLSLADISVPSPQTAGEPIGLTEVNRRSKLSLTLYDLDGRKLAAKTWRDAGPGRLATNPMPGVSPGVYFAVLEADDGKSVRKVQLIK